MRSSVLWQLLTGWLPLKVVRRDPAHSNSSIFWETDGKTSANVLLVVAGSLLIAFVTIRLKDSRLGRQWMAMREDEDVAEAMGINLVQTKLLAFSVGAGFSALAGAIFAARVGNIFPHSFNLIDLP